MEVLSLRPLIIGISLKDLTQYILALSAYPALCIRTANY
jgi:hypothetical protein